LAVTDYLRHLRVTPGSLCTDRLPGPLDELALRVRPATLAENFCAAGQRLGAAGANLRPETEITPLARLFLSEPAYLLSEILSFNAEDAEQTFQIALEEEPGAAPRLIAALARQVRDWVARARLLLPDTFSKQLQQLNAEGTFEDSLPCLAARTAPEVVDAVVKIEQRREDALQVLRDDDPVARLRRIEAALRATHALLRNSVVTLQPVARTAFAARIASGQIDPALGLLLAELRAAEDVDEAINAAARRHMRYYYDDIIGQRPKPATGESVLLHLPPSARPRFLPEGTGLQARAADGTLQRFVTEAPVSVSPAHVASTAVLIYDTDRRISFNAALAGITDVRAHHYPGGMRTVRDGVFGTASRVDVEMGLDISSPMLALAEGERWIELTLSMRRSSNLPAEPIPLPPDAPARSRATGPEPETVLALRSDPELLRAFGLSRDAAWIEVIADQVEALADSLGVTPALTLVYQVLALRALDLGALRVLLGRIVALALVERAPLPQGDYWEMLRAKIDVCRDQLSGQAQLRHIDAGDSVSIIFEAFARNPDGSFVYTPEDIFQKLLGDAFKIAISTPEGMRTADWTQILPAKKTSGGGLRLRLKLDAAFPPVTAPDGAAAPLLTIRAADSARICPVSVFERYHLVTLGFDVRAEGLRALTGFSDDGPVTTDQTFMPFGPRPGDGTSFTVGSPELAQKPVTEIGLALNWAEIPDPVGGFQAHYRHYPDIEEVPDPKVSVSYLSGDGWKAVTDAPVPLFTAEPVTGALQPAWTFEAEVPGQAVPATGPVRVQDFQSRQSMRAGAVRLMLGDTANGFHADRYPLALVEAMRPSRMPFSKREVPAAPFVPRAASLSLSYTASEIVELNAPASARAGERVVQVSPFGRVEVFPRRVQRAITLLPPRLGYGHLFVELDGPHATGPLTLLFEVAESGHLRLVPDPNPIDWVYLTETGWAALPATAVLSDSTAGLMRSGLVTIDLPEDAAWASPEMPGRGVWLGAVAKAPNLDIFPTLTRVETNGLLARRIDDSFGDAEAQVRAWSFEPPLPGLGTVREVAVSATVRPPETHHHYIARVGERLRHRKRAVTPWDMERMVLEEFPEVWMAKCLSHLDRRTPKPVPGHVTLVAVRHAPRTEQDRAPGAHLFDVNTLRRIEEFLTAHAPGFARIEVANPAFERLQVRAKLAFDHFRDDGAMARRVNAEIARYLTVWTAPPELARFGWSLNTRALRSHIDALDFVRGVSDFSVLHLVADDERRYALMDTAQTDGRGPHGATIRPTFPWSLPLSVPNHALITVPDAEGEDPVQSGIGRLSIGDMFIVRQRTQP